MKIHIGADVNSGAVQSVRVTAANEADINRLSNLLREDDQAIFADAGYSSESYEIRFAPVGFARVCQGQAQTGHGNLSASRKKRNRRNSRVRARVAHWFRVIKCQFGYRKVRYKGLAKNTAQVMSLMALAKLYRFRRQIMAQ